MRRTRAAARLFIPFLPIAAGCAPGRDTTPPDSAHGPAQAAVQPPPSPPTSQPPPPAADTALPPGTTPAPCLTLDGSVVRCFLRRIEPLRVADRTFAAEIRYARYAREDAVEGVRVLDEGGTVVLEEIDSLAVRGSGFEAFCHRSVLELEAGTAGGIAIRRECLPSAPMGGVSYEFFSLHQGRLMSVAPPLSVYGQFPDLPQGLGPWARRLPERGRIQVMVWEGHFGVIVPVHIRLDGPPADIANLAISPPRRDPDSGLDLFDLTDFSLWRVDEGASVKLYPRPTGDTGSPVSLHRDMNIEFLEVAGSAHLKKGLHWRGYELEVDVTRLRVRINGREGWVDWSDYTALGLGSAG